jgi:hypothetical protein
MSSDRTPPPPFPQAQQYPQAQQFGQPAPGYQTNPSPVEDTYLPDPGQGALRPRRAGRRKGTVAAIATAAGVATVAAGGYFAYGMIGGGGERADAMLPSSAVAVVTVDLDPSASQKLGAVRFARKFPEAKNLDWDSADSDPRKWLYERMTQDYDKAPPWAEVNGWLGKRAGLAVVPPAGQESEPGAVIALQVSDQVKAKATLGRLTDPDTDQPVGVAGEGEWVLISRTQAAADAALASAKASPIAQDSTYKADVDALGDEGIANAWFDSARLGALAKGLPIGAGLTGLASAKGHGATTLRFDGTTLELAGSFRDGGPLSLSPAVSKPAELEAPAEAVAALSVAGLGEQLSTQWSTLLQEMGTVSGEVPTAAELEQQTGMKLPADLKALFGEQFTVILKATGDEPTVGVRVKSSDPELTPALDRLSELAQRQGTELVSSPFPGGYALGFGAGVQGLADGGTLSSTPAFTDAVPEVGKANAVGYLDISRTVEQFRGGGEWSAQERANVEPLKALGFSATADSATSSSFLIRLTTK